MKVRFGPFELASELRQVLKNGVEVHLTPKAFDLFELLIAEAPRVLRKNELHDRLWPGTFVSDATLVGLVKEVRRALDDRDATSPLIRTAHGVGYAFAGTLERVVVRPAVTRWIVADTRRIPLPTGEHVIGRHPAAAVFLDVPGVSRRHARIVISDGGALLEDLGSKNGTKLRNKSVTGAMPLRDGDEIHVGPSRLIFYASATNISTETIL